MKHRAFLDIQRDEQFFFDRFESPVGRDERLFALRREFDDVAPPVRSVPAARDEFALLELVQQPDDIARIKGQNVAEFLLAQLTALVHDPECVEVSRP